MTIEQVLNIVEWLGAPLFVGLLIAVYSPRTRPEAISTLLIAIPFALLLASNNNQAHAVRNFFGGMLMVAVPLLLHAFCVMLIRRKQSNPTFERDVPQAGRPTM